ncbi:TRM11 family SAM-dependent methyltransferase [Paenibacillus lautus]|uniref:TRM11 family SAM-dependent methyltransferase n=1 Tax=Paenibacillus lautus TaxID=1401 RepID=UPI003D27BAED
MIKMMRYITFNKSNIDEYLADNVVIVFRLRKSRIKAKQLGIIEAYFALSSVGGLFIPNGPLGDVKGIFSFFVPIKYLNELPSVLSGIGYCNQFYLLDFRCESSENNSDLVSINELIWKRKRFSINNFFFQELTLYEQHSPNNRQFKILNHNNEVKVVNGYRGDGTETGRRALPVEDARCLVNLAEPYTSNILLDPFAGGGGVVFQAKFIKESMEVYSVDVDPILAPGLQSYGSKHYVANSSVIEFEKELFDSIVTEVPFSPNATGEVIKSIGNLSSSLKECGNLVLMCSAEQSEKIEQFVNDLGFYRYVFERINRKGTDVVIMAWFKSFERFKNNQDFLDVVKTIY